MSNNYEVRGARNYSPKVIRVRQLVELPGLALRAVGVTVFQVAPGDF